ncbi:unnamed protein product [Oncorhynchus mykiss]|uniref:Uncharacterized protein n=1 Tax=Oncorhynchus mykiss TaxID=8022 RepID=A0A060XBC6_ONCMY|nr:unnamed protein product [Oncorhynchus mykiss]
MRRSMRTLSLDGLVLGRSVDTPRVGSHILTKNVGSDGPQSLTYCANIMKSHATVEPLFCCQDAKFFHHLFLICLLCMTFFVQQFRVWRLTKCQRWGRTFACSSQSPQEHVNAQTKEYNGSPQGTQISSFILHHEQVMILSVHHQIPYSEYENMLVGEGLLNVAVVIKDELTEERVLASEEFNIIAPQISIEVVGGDNIQQKKEHSALVSLTNGFAMPLSSAVLTAEGSGLLEGKDQTKVCLPQPGQTIERKVSFTPTTTGTKLVQASLAYNNSSTAIRSFHKVSVFA